MKKQGYRGLILLTIILIVLAVAMGTYFVSTGQFLSTPGAWGTNQSANAVCADSGAVIKVTFTNTELNESQNAMNVEVVDDQTGKSVNLGTVNGGSVATGEIQTGQRSLNSGTVRFKLTWADGHSGTDSRTEAYSAVNCPQATPTVTPKPTSGGTPASCPSGTGLLFTGSSLSTGTSVNYGGKITQASGSWRMDNQDGVQMAIYGTTMTVDFTDEVYMDTVLIFDNDPKSGEKPWSINGVSLPTTSQNKWAPPFKLNITSNKMTFDYGGDSSHFNVCISQPQPTATKTPTASPTKIPTPTKTPTPTPIGCSSCTSSNPYLCTSNSNPANKLCNSTNNKSGYDCSTNCFPTTPTPTPTLCITPKAVTDLKISCPLCQ